MAETDILIFIGADYLIISFRESHALIRRITNPQAVPFHFFGKELSATVRRGRPDMRGPVLFRIGAIMILKVHQDKRFHANHGFNLPCDGGIMFQCNPDRATDRSLRISGILVI